MENSKLAIFNNAFNENTTLTNVNAFNASSLTSKLGICAPTIYAAKAIEAIFSDDREVWTKTHYNLDNGDEDLLIYVKNLNKAKAINFCIKHVVAFPDPKEDDPNYKHYTRIKVYHTNEQGEDEELPADDGQYFTDMLTKFRIDGTAWWGTWFQSWKQLNPDLVGTEEEIDARPYWIPDYQKLFFNVLAIAFAGNKVISKTEVVVNEFFEKTYYFVMASKIAKSFLVDNIANPYGYESALAETLIKFGLNLPSYILVSTLA